MITCSLTHHAKQKVTRLPDLEHDRGPTQSTIKCSNGSGQA